MLLLVRGRFRCSTNDLSGGLEAAAVVLGLGERLPKLGLARRGLLGQRFCRAASRRGPAGSPLLGACTREVSEPRSGERCSPFRSITRHNQRVVWMSACARLS